jgi:hypothetical protein
LILSQSQNIVIVVLAIFALFALPVHAQPGGPNTEAIALQEDHQSPMVGSGQPPTTFAPSLGLVQPSQSTAPSQKLFYSKIKMIIIDAGSVRIRFEPTETEIIPDLSLSLDNDADLPLHQRMYDLLFYASTNDLPIGILYDPYTNEIQSVALAFEPTSLQALPLDQNPSSSLTTEDSTQRFT